MKTVALYARVSSESQEKQTTVDSQLAALTERAKTHGHTIIACDSYIDDGYSGSTLVRPALEKLRDRAAEGGLDLLYVHSPDRLARKYAYQVLLLEELSRNGVSVVFLNGPTNRTAEDELLLQVQGMIAEYERAKILERSRESRKSLASSEGKPQGREASEARPPGGFTPPRRCSGTTESRTKVGFMSSGSNLDRALVQAW